MKKFIFNLLIIGLITSLFTSCDTTTEPETEEEETTGNVSSICNKTWGDETYYIFIEVVTDDAVFFTYYDATYGVVRYFYDYTFDEATQTIYFMYEGVQYFTFVIQEDGSVYNALNDVTLTATADLVADTYDNIVKNTQWVDTYGYSIDFLTNKYCNFAGYGEDYTLDESAGTIYFVSFNVTATYTDTQIVIPDFYDGADGVFVKQ
ncbi:MAG: hypothetical protein R3Y59_02990 [bacterium]